VLHEFSEAESTMGAIDVKSLATSIERRLAEVR
jgi:hypothetical protein